MPPNVHYNVHENVHCHVHCYVFSQLQIEMKVTRRWQLTDLLHICGMDNVSQSNYGDPGRDYNTIQDRPVTAKISWEKTLSTIPETKRATRGHVSCRQKHYLRSHENGNVRR